MLLLQMSLQRLKQPKFLPHFKYINMKLWTESSKTPTPKNLIKKPKSKLEQSPN